MNKIAVLITCYNRKEKTLYCLNQLSAYINQNFENCLEIYLVDDGSTDGTSLAIRNNFPFVKLIQGSGKLFWAGGMRLAWETATKFLKYDYYLLLNDDTILFSNTIEILLSANKRNKAAILTDGITIGTTIDEETGKVSYGGSLLNNKFSPKSKKVFKENVDMICDLGNANIMLVPKEVVNKIGILSTHYTHGLADFDYTLRAKKVGFWVMVAPSICGYCKNDHGKRWKSAVFSLQERIKFLHNPKGLAYRQYMFLLKSHFPYYLPIAFTKLWIKTIFPFLYDRFKKD